MIFFKKYHSLRSRCTCVEVTCAGKDRAHKGDMQWERKHLPERPMKIVSPLPIQLPGSRCMICQKFLTEND